MALTSPQSLKHEHEELHAKLVSTTKAGGKTGPAAQAVAQMLQPHFVKKEKERLDRITIDSLEKLGHKLIE